MPYKTDKYTLSSPFLKKSAKLLPCQIEMIHYWRGKGESHRQLAKRFKVSKRMIQFTLDPRKHKDNLRKRQENGGSKQYYDTEKNNEATREHRRYKHRTLKK